MREASSRESASQPRRYLGLELSGAKNQKTALAAIQFYPKEKKVFLLDIYDRISGHEKQTGDEALLEVIGEMKTDVAKMGVNVPLELPPCLKCTRIDCPCPVKPPIPAVKYMRELTKRASRKHLEVKVKEFTPYTQRPIELWVKYFVMPELHPSGHFEVDETLGGNKAPLTARMQYLKRYLDDLSLIEAWPKLTIAVLARELGLNYRIINSYRKLEEGAHARAKILESLADAHGIFIYDRDLRKISLSLTAFDAFICAYTALLEDTGRCARMPQGFPAASGWLAYPELNEK